MRGICHRTPRPGGGAPLQLQPEKLLGGYDQSDITQDELALARNDPARDDPRRMSEVTRILNSIHKGDPRAAEELLPLIYEELRKLAAAKMNQEPPGQTLQATALVHEAWMRLAGDRQEQGWDSRGHFFSAAAEAMRRILVERARRKDRIRHGGGLERIEIDQIAVPNEAKEQKLLEIHEVIDQFAEEDESKAELVKLRVFVGLNYEEIANLMGISEPTVRRHWAYAKAWLYERIHEARQQT
jgi:RNA polymerase sigma factor (TIGR02999 family)